MHRKATKTIHPRYRYECPANCEKQSYNIRRREKCETCPLVKSEKTFRKNTLETIEKMLGWRAAEKFDFDKLLSTLYTVIGLEDMPKEKLSIKNYQMLSVFLSEKNYSDELDDLKK